jgi:hypothetical protein
MLLLKEEEGEGGGGGGRQQLLVLRLRQNDDAAAKVTFAQRSSICRLDAETKEGMGISRCLYTLWHRLVNCHKQRQTLYYDILLALFVLMWYNAGKKII